MISSALGQLIIRVLSSQISAISNRMINPAPEELIIWAQEQVVSGVPSLPLDGLGQLRGHLESVDLPRMKGLFDDAGMFEAIGRGIIMGRPRTTTTSTSAGAHAVSADARSRAAGQAARFYDAPGGVDAAPRCRDGVVTSTS
jgi:hypothetical protein